MAERLAAVNVDGVFRQFGYDLGACGQCVNRRIDLVGKLHDAGVVALAGHGYFIRTGVGAGFGICYGVVGVFGQLAAVSNRNGGLLLAAVISKFSIAQRKVIRHKALGVNGKVGRGRADGGVCAFFKAGSHGVAARIGGGRFAFGIGGAISALVGVAYASCSVGGACGHRGRGFITIGVICHSHTAAAVGLFDRVSACHTAGVVALAGHGYGIRTGDGAAFVTINCTVIFCSQAGLKLRLLHFAVISKLGRAEFNIVICQFLGRNRKAVCSCSFIIDAIGINKSSRYRIFSGVYRRFITVVVITRIAVAYISRSVGGAGGHRGGGFITIGVIFHGHGAAARHLVDHKLGCNAVQHAGSISIFVVAIKINAYGVSAGQQILLHIRPLAAFCLIAQLQIACACYVFTVAITQPDSIGFNLERRIIIYSDITQLACCHRHRQLLDLKAALTARKSASCIVIQTGQLIGHSGIFIATATAAARVGYFVIRSCGQLVSVGILQGQFVGIQRLICAVITASVKIFTHSYHAGVGRNAAGCLCRIFCIST